MWTIFSSVNQLSRSSSICANIGQFHQPRKIGIAGDNFPIIYTKYRNFNFFYYRKENVSFSVMFIVHDLPAASRSNVSILTVWISFWFSSSVVRQCFLRFAGRFNRNWIRICKLIRMLRFEVIIENVQFYMTMLLNEWQINECMLCSVVCNHIEHSFSNVIVFPSHITHTL